MTREQSPLPPGEDGSKKGRALQYAKKISISLVSLLVTLVSCEVILWEIDYTYKPLEIKREGADGDWRRFHAFEDEDFIYDPKLIWRPKRSYSVFNAQGFRGREFSEHKAPGEFRIFAVGDSNTLGWNDAKSAKEQDKGSWPGFLQDRLDALGEGFTVVNAGVWAYSSFQGLERLQEIMEWEPDMVLFSFGANDAIRVPISDAEFGASSLTPAVANPLLSTRIGQVVLAARDRLSASMRSGGTEDFVPRVSVREYEENLKAAIEITRKKNIPCILFTRPFTGTSHSEIWWKNFAPDYVEATRRLGAANDVQVIDLYAHFEDKGDYFSDECHFTKEGHRLAADIVLEEIRSLLPPGTPPGTPPETLPRPSTTKPESTSDDP